MLSKYQRNTILYLLISFGLITPQELLGALIPLSVSKSHCSGPMVWVELAKQLVFLLYVHGILHTGGSTLSSYIHYHLTSLLFG